VHLSAVQIKMLGYVCCFFHQGAFVQVSARGGVLCPPSGASHDDTGSPFFLTLCLRRPPLPFCPEMHVCRPHLFCSGYVAFFQVSHAADIEGTPSRRLFSAFCALYTDPFFAYHLSPANTRATHYPLFYLLPVCPLFLRECFCFTLVQPPRSMAPSPLFSLPPDSVLVVLLPLVFKASFTSSRARLDPSSSERFAFLTAL